MSRQEVDDLLMAPSSPIDRFTKWTSLCNMLFSQYDCEICQCTHIVIVYMALTVLYYLYTVGICLLSDV